MRAPSSSINLSQTLYDALREGYVNGRAAPVIAPVRRQLPDIGMIASIAPEPEETPRGQ